MCDACQRPVADNAHLCAACTGRLERDLGEIGALAEELQTTRLRQSRTGGQPTGVLSRSSDRPLPWDQRAAETAYVLRSTVVVWVRVVLEERGGRLPSDTMPALGRFLLANLEWLRHHPAAEQCADEIGSAVALARRAIDRRAERTYVGPCRETVDPHGEEGESCCLSELHVRVGSRTVACPRCAAEHDVADRKAWLLAVAENQLVTIAELCRLLILLDRKVPRATVDSWVRRHRLVPHGTGDRALFRVGDAIDLLVERKASA